MTSTFAGRLPLRYAGGKLLPNDVHPINTACKVAMRSMILLPDSSRKSSCLLSISLKRVTSCLPSSDGSCESYTGICCCSFICSLCNPHALRLLLHTDHI